MKIAEIMSPKVTMINLDTTLLEAAQKMKMDDVGALPVNDGEKIRGMITDRDIVVRAVAAGKDLSLTTAKEIMTEKIRYVFEDEDISVAANAMKDKQIRRLVVLSRTKRLVGLLSLGDLALRSNDQHMSGEVVRGVSEPSGEHVVH